MNLLVQFLIFLLIVCLIAYVAAYILAKLDAPVPPRFVWAIAGVAVLIWILEHLSTLQHIAG